MRRSRFGDGLPSQGDNDYADNTKYDAKYIKRTDEITPDFGTSSVYAVPDKEPGQPQAFNDPMQDGLERVSTRPSLYTTMPDQRVDGGYAGVQPTTEQRVGGAYGNGYGGATVVATQQSEAPRVFALRSDPTLYVYEYSDRLEYYRNTPGGMMLCNVEYKKTR